MKMAKMTFERLNQIHESRYMIFINDTIFLSQNIHRRSTRAKKSLMKIFTADTIRKESQLCM